MTPPHGAACPLPLPIVPAPGGSRSRPQPEGRAYATLRRGAHFVATLADRGISGEPWPPGRAGQLRARYIGNCLRELDRFFAALLDDGAAPRAPGPLTLRQTVAVRLGECIPSSAARAQAQDRLRALDRSRRCLVHGGYVRHPDMAEGAWMTAGWRVTGTPTLRRYPIGAMLRPRAEDLADIAAFYLALADQIAVVR